MTNPQPSRQETGPVLLVDCPLCDLPAPLDEGSGTLDCTACGVRLDGAPDPEPLVLAPAA